MSIRRSTVVISFFVATACFIATSAFADNVAGGPRHAVVVGNGDYADLSKLKNPSNDAADMAAALQALGFQVDLLTNADLPAMEAAVVRLGQKLSLQADSLGLFFYAGHGVQSDGINYLIPADAKILSESFLKTKALPAQAVLDILEGARNALNVIILDACRDNPFSWARGGSRGLTVVGKQPAGSIIAYATSTGSVAADGSGRNGVFTAELLQEIKTPGVEVKDLFNRVGKRVSSVTAGKQIPAVYNQFFDNAYLTAAATLPAPTLPVSTVVEAPKFAVPSNPNPSAALAIFGELFVTSVPADAELYIDNVLVGKTGGLISNVVAGQPISVQARKGSMAATATFTLAKNELKVLELTLAALKGNLYLKAKGAEGCTVSIGGRNLGAYGSGLFRDLEIGDQAVVVRGNGLFWQGTVNVPADKTGQLEITLGEVGSLDIRVPADAQFRASKAGSLVYSRSGAAIIDDVPIGEYSVEASGSGYDAAAGSLSVSRGTASRWEPWTTGSVAVVTEPSSANIYSNGKRIGSSPLTIRDLAAGKVGLVAKMDGYGDAAADVVVVIGKTAQVAMTLKKTTPATVVAPTVAPAVVPPVAVTAGTVVPAGMVAIPAGSFSMGDTAGGGESDEKPLHSVAVGAFYMAKYETTVDEFRAFITASGYRTSAEALGYAWTYEDGEWDERSDRSWSDPGLVQAGNEPVVCVSWYDAIAYCNWRSEVEKRTPVYSYAARGSDFRKWPGIWNTETHNKINADPKATGYRLPTEAEWEYAAKTGGKDRALTYAGGNQIDNFAWYIGNSNERTNTVGRKRPNGFNLYDMSGNVWEWCWDWFGSYDAQARTDPRGPDSGDQRVERGGCWTLDATDARISRRIGDDPWESYSIDGFRVVLPTLGGVPVVSGVSSGVAVAVVDTSLALHGEILVEGGSFQMGSDSGDDDESPIHSVTLKPFWMMKTEIAQKDYTALIGSNPSNSEGDNLPVEEVTWYEAVAYANKLSQSDGLKPAYAIAGTTVVCDWNANGWRLPTEAEWEYAARGGKISRGYTYSGSNRIEAVAWYADNSDDGTKPVGTKSGNELGIRDLSGNVWEWCWDLYGDYSAGSQTNPTGPSSESLRILRGGDWSGDASFARTTYRCNYDPEETDDDIGFRLVRAATPVR